MLKRDIQRARGRLIDKEPIDTNCMTLTRWILAEKKKYAPDSTGQKDEERYTKS